MDAIDSQVLAETGQNRKRDLFIDEKGSIPLAYAKYLILFFLLVFPPVIIAQDTGQSPTEPISLSTYSAALGETIYITLFLGGIDEPRLVVKSPNQESVYLDPPRQVRYMPSIIGEYSVALYDRKYLVKQMAFQVEDNEIPEPVQKSEAEEEIVLIQDTIMIQAGDPSVGKPVTIQINAEEYESLSMSIVSRQKSFKIFKVQKEIRFVPKTAGLHIVELFEKGKVIASNSFIANDGAESAGSEEPNITPQQEQTPEADILIPIDDFLDKYDKDKKTKKRYSIRDKHDAEVESEITIEFAESVVDPSKQRPNIHVRSFAELTSQEQES
ncbi:MAG: hypothetical protein KKF44_01120, partial [Nanoarchaeota archaeon]|nr:hypothetical protein [Nanoarchaeota archaeon]